MMKFDSHLLLERFSLPPGHEWVASPSAWHIIRFKAGAGYWLHRTQCKALAEGDILVLAPQTPGSIRASLIGAVELQTFRFDPGCLYGVLSLGERQFFLEQARVANRNVRAFPAEHSAARAFAALDAQATEQRALGERAGILAVLAAIFDEELTHRQGNE